MSSSALGIEARQGRDARAQPRGSVYESPAVPKGRSALQRLADSAYPIGRPDYFPRWRIPGGPFTSCSTTSRSGKPTGKRKVGSAMHQT
jgi:hypothetical protein